MLPSGQPEPESPNSAGIRASDQDRDTVVQRLQMAFAERRLDDGEFDDRMRAALTARTSSELDVLTADLPADAPGRSAAVPGPSSGRFAITYKARSGAAGAGGCPSASSRSSTRAAAGLTCGQPS